METPQDTTTTTTTITALRAAIAAVAGRPDEATAERPAISRRLSHSSLEMFEQCGQKYRLRKIERRPEAPSGALILGTAFHAAIEHIGEALLLDAPVPSNVEAKMDFLAAFDADLAGRDPHGVIDHAEAALLAAKGLAALDTFYDRVLPTYRPVAVEEAFDGPVPGLAVRGWGFTGRIDARTQARQRDGTTVETVLDFKTAGKPWDSRKLDTAMRQATAYALGTRLSGRPIAGQTTFLVFVSQVPTGWKPPSTLTDPDAAEYASAGGVTAVMQVHRHFPDEADVDAYAGTLRRVVGRIEAGEFEPNPGPLCGWCTYAGDGSCPIGAAWLREHGRTATPEIVRFVEREKERSK